MGLSDLFSDVISSLGFGEALAEAPPADQQEEQPEIEEKSTDGVPEIAETTEEQSEEAQEEEGPTEEEANAEEEEEEEEEPEDVKPKLEEDCASSSHCAPFKHHFDECVARVTSHGEDPDYKGPSEDCVEEFFHLQHCVTECAAPKLWKLLK